VFTDGGPQENGARFCLYCGLYCGLPLAVSDAEACQAANSQDKLSMVKVLPSRFDFAR
jgi:hypothetical protein